MATLTVRNLPEATRRALKERAARNNRSMEAEARTILSAAVHGEEDFVAEWLDLAAEFRGEFELPPRSTAREIDLA
jgi:plasmid stability protein